MLYTEERLNNVETKTTIKAIEIKREKRKIPKILSKKKKDSRYSHLLRDKLRE